jgi:hypothetical protein
MQSCTVKKLLNLLPCFSYERPATLWNGRLAVITCEILYLLWSTGMYNELTRYEKSAVLYVMEVAPLTQ